LDHLPVGNRKEPPDMSTLDAHERLYKPIPDSLNSDRLVADKVVAELMDISLATLRRMRARGEGPPRRRVSPHRYGTRLRDIAQFLDRAAV
jgi:hypothetical protein